MGGGVLRFRHFSAHFSEKAAFNFFGKEAGRVAFSRPALRKYISLKGEGRVVGEVGLSVIKPAVLNDDGLA